MSLVFTLRSSESIGTISIWRKNWSGGRWRQRAIKRAPKPVASPAFRAARSGQAWLYAPCLQCASMLGAGNLFATWIRTHFLSPKWGCHLKITWPNIPASFPLSEGEWPYGDGHTGSHEPFKHCKALAKTHALRKGFTKRYKYLPKLVSAIFNGPKCIPLETLLVHMP